MLNMLQVFNTNLVATTRMLQGLNVKYTVSLRSWKPPQTLMKMVALSNTLAWVSRASGHETYVGYKIKKSGGDNIFARINRVMELWLSIQSHPSQLRFELLKPRFDLTESHLSISKAGGQGKQPRRPAQGSPGPLCRDWLWRVLVISKTV